MNNEEIADRLIEITEQLGHFPKKQELYDLKEWKLCNEIQKSLHTLGDFRVALGHDLLRNPAGYWTEERLTEEIAEICKEEGGWPNKHMWNKEYCNVANAAYKVKSLKYFREKLGIKYGAGSKELNCQHCNQLFRPEVSEKNWTRQKFCSHDCMYHFHRLKNNAKKAIEVQQPKICPICNKEFTPNFTTKQKYCERACFTRFRKRMDKGLRRTLEAINSGKNGKYSHHLLGYTAEDLLEHVQSFPRWNEICEQEWHLDHIFPINAFFGAWY